MEHLSQYIEADYAVLSAVLYCLGRVLKALGRFPNRLIPLTLTGCGIALACLFQRRKSVFVSGFLFFSSKRWFAGSALVILYKLRYNIKDYGQCPMMTY